MRKFILICLLTMLPAGAWAQCTGGLINNCPKAVSPQAGDYVLGWQNSQSPHTRAVTDAQVVAGALQQPLTTKLTTLTAGPGGAGLNLGIGGAPTPCVVGDLWMTGTGTFDCHAGAPFLLGGGGSGGSSNFTTYANAAALPSVTAVDAGKNAYVLNCQNGSQGPIAGTGCYYNVNAAGVWTANPSPSNQTITIGGQAVYLGGSTNNQGNGTKLQLASGGFTAGNALIYDASGNAVDAGVPPTGGSGGSGTVTSALVNSLPFYSASPSGSTLAGMAKVPNSVLTINGSGVPSESTTLPPGLILQTPTISSPTVTGTTSQAITNMTGKLTTVASISGGAGFNLAQGVAPSSPANGDIWETPSAIFARVNGTTQTLLGGILVNGPIVGILNGAIESLSCPTCATTTTGGALTATAPMTISSGGLISLGLQPAPIVWIADSATAVHNDTYNLIEKSPWANNVTVNSITYHTGGTNTPSFTASLQINGAPVTGCNGIGVSSSTDATATCTGANILGNLGTLSLVISGTSGSPVSAVVQVNVSKPAS